MRTHSLALALISALAVVPAAAQDTPPVPAEGETPAPAAPGAPLSMGQPVAPDGEAIGSPYVKAEHADWDLRCIRTQSGKDPCQLYQLLDDDEGNAVAEFTLFPLVPAQGEAVAGGNIMTPLETLLTEGVSLAIDGAEGRRFPFHFCAEAGCVARVGYTQADIDRLKRGREATVAMVPVIAANQRITLTLSLTGFTAAYDQLAAETAAMAAEAEAEGQDGAAEGEGAQGGN